MTQRTLYKIIEKIGSQDFADEEALITAIIQEFIHNDRINIIGGRIWKLDAETKSYSLLYEEGTIDAIGIGFKITLRENDVFEQVAKKRTVLADETNKVLKIKGIKRYSATGVGDLVRIGRNRFYEYMLAFNTVTMDPEMSFIMNIAGQGVTQLLQQRRTEAERRILQSDLEHASELQRRILPQHEYQFGHYDLYGISLPDRIVGGDFFNYYTMEDATDHRLGVAIGDAASKGMPAAVQALFVSGALMMSIEFEAKITTVIRRINRITHMMFPRDRFLTLFYCELFDSADGLVLYANAGHPGPLHFHAATQEVTTLAVTGTVLGLLPDSKYGIASIVMAPGDVLVIYTDGISEANDGNEEYGEERLKNIILAHPRSTAKRIAQHILQDVQVYGANSTYSDDKTIVVIKRKK